MNEQLRRQMGDWIFGFSLGPVDVQNGTTESLCLSLLRLSPCKGWLLPCLVVRMGLGHGPGEADSEAGLQNIFRPRIPSRNPEGCLMMSEIAFCAFFVPLETQSREQKYCRAVKPGF